MRTLRLTSGPASGQSLEIDREVVVGREGGDLTIDDAELSRRHVALRPVEGGIEVEDLGSLNGTFVNGQRISSPLTVKSNGILKIGISEGALEVTLPQATRMADVAAPPDATVARPIVDPNATVQREVMKPEVAAERPVADPEVTAQRPVADPEVTAQRPVPDGAPPNGPELTVQRPVEAGPPGGAPPPAAPPSPAERPSEGRGGPPLPLIVGVVVLVVLIALAVLLLSGGDSEATKRKIDYTHELTAPTQRDKRLSESVPGKTPVSWTLTGRSKGRPFGTGRTTTAVTLQPAGPPPGAPKSAAPPPPPPKGRPKEATVTVRFNIRLKNGTLIVTERLKSRRTRSSVEFSGIGRITGGTGDFKDAKGSFKVTGGRPKFEESFETARWTGTVEY